jgi:pyrimidine-specific ribonucleoside hydrolase
MYYRQYWLIFIILLTFTKDIQMKKVIFDTDGGGDDLWALAVLVSLVKQGKIELLGITTCFGNTNVTQATRNICDMLDYLGLPDIPVYQGYDGPMSGLPPLLDGAYGENGLSNATLLQSSIDPQSMHATQWMAETLKSTTNPVTILGTGPATNMAEMFQNAPDLDRDDLNIIWLGGSLYPSGGHHQLITLPNGDYKQGNITHHAEFNAINDPIAAQILADLKQANVTIMPLDAGQHMDVDVTRATDLGRRMKGMEAIAINMLSMLDQAAILDQDKFKAHGGFAFDPQVPTFMMNPDLFLPVVPVRDVRFENNHKAAKDFDVVASGFDFAPLGTHGKMSATPCEQSNVSVIPGLYSFTKPENVSKQDIADITTMVENRWRVLSGCVISSFEE